MVRSLAGRLGVDVSRIGQCEEGGAQGRFEWVDGPLTVAVEVRLCNVRANQSDRC